MPPVISKFAPATNTDNSASGGGKLTLTDSESQTSDVYVDPNLADIISNVVTNIKSNQIIASKKTNTSVKHFSMWQKCEQKSKSN